MISALAKIENRGELASANSAVMEMCIDNSALRLCRYFSPPTRRSTARRGASSNCAGGHDPEALTLDAPTEQGQIEPPLADRPWARSAAAKRQAVFAERTAAWSHPRRQRTVGIIAD